MQTVGSNMFAVVVVVIGLLFAGKMNMESLFREWYTQKLPSGAMPVPFVGVGTPPLCKKATTY
jgi:hypothetical protein